MGMAASQARFLSLTARKSNVEYEGQQVNQQRTALANESANLYNQLTAIEVPTPPSTSDYYETVYTFKTTELDNTQASNTQYTLDKVYTSPDGMYAQLSYMTHYWDSAYTSAYAGDVNFDDKNGYSVSLLNGAKVDATEYKYQPAEEKFSFSASAGSSLSIGNVEFSISDSGKSMASTELDAKGNPLYRYDITDNGDGTFSVALKVQKDDNNEDGFKYTFAGQDYDVVKQADGTYVAMVPSGAEETEETNDGVSGKYVDGTGAANSGASYFEPSFFEANGLENQPILAYDYNGQTYFISSAEFAKGSFVGSAYVANCSKQETVSYPCTYTTAPSGRYQSLTITDDNNVEHTFSLEVQNVEDEEAYRQAMLDYEYEQSKYHKKIQDINAKTEKIQQEDRTLELRLKQLDTEQDALKTEMDAVKEVIKNNVESTFKTFA